MAVFHFLSEHVGTALVASMLRSPGSLIFCRESLIQAMRLAHPY